jgi:hypothetical protein
MFLEDTFPCDAREVERYGGMVLDGIRQLYQWVAAG